MAKIDSPPPPFEILTTTQSVQAFCDEARRHDFIAIDTEFYIRRTYYPKLCLVQIAYGEGDAHRVGLVDPLEGDADLTALKALLSDENVVKVFHAARQDMEIFYDTFALLPRPLFDTQIAAMVCGFDEQVGYDRLVSHFTGHVIDKSKRFTDWRTRPLSESQMRYAAGDVIHLHEIYPKLLAHLEKTGRGEWVREDMDALLDASRYEKKPQEAWKRLKLRSSSREFSARVMQLAALREREAKARNLSRTLTMRDELILEIAASNPESRAALEQISAYAALKKGAKMSGDIMKALDEAKALALQIELKKPDKSLRHKNPALATLLRVLLKFCAQEADVSQMMLASSAELDLLAAGGRDMACLRGWRYDVFGERALRLCAGKLAIGVRDEKLEMIAVEAKKS